MVATNPQGVGPAVAEVEPQLVSWRRHLHRHPELSFEEVQTARYVEAALGELGLETVRPTRTSVMATLRSGRPGPTIVLRADIDALPIQEESGLDFASQTDGVMHACGHDGHSAVLLATAHVLTRLTDLPAGEARFLFQHAEEEVHGGAPELVAAGVLEGADAILGQHLWTALEAGTVGVVAGPMMASADFFDVEIQGVGGHAGLPHEGIDAVAVAAQVVTNLQHLVAREANPLDSLVVSVTRLRAGEVNNVSPERASVHGTVRSFSDELRRSMPDRIERLASGVAAAHRATAMASYRCGPPAVVNDPALAELLAGAVRRQVGDQALCAPAPVMAGDDFSYFQRELPGAYFFVGAGGSGAFSFPHHHPRFALDERALPIAVRVLVDAVLELSGGTP